MELEQLPGTVLPSGHYRIEPYENRLMHNVVGVEPADEPHPIYGFIIAQCGLGISVAELLELIGSRAEDGPMLGECTIDFHRPLATGTEYSVHGTVTSAERKVGRSLGTFDVVTVEQHVSSGTGQPVVTTTSTFLLPRKDTR